MNKGINHQFISSKFIQVADLQPHFQHVRGNLVDKTWDKPCNSADEPDIIRFSGLRHPREMGQPEVETFLTMLANALGCTCRMR